MLPELALRFCYHKTFMSVVASPIVFGHNWVTEFCYSTCYNQQHSTSTTLLSFVQHCKTIQAGSEARTPIDTEALQHASQGNQRSPFGGACWPLLLVLNSKVFTVCAWLCDPADSVPAVGRVFRLFNRCCEDCEDFACNSSLQKSRKSAYCLYLGQFR